MSNTDAKRHARYTRQGVRAKMQETLETDGTIEYLVNEDDEGSLLLIPHPFFYDKATRDALKEVADDDEDGRVRVLLGDEQFARFIELGGDPADIDMLTAQVQRDAKAAFGGPTKK